MNPIDIIDMLENHKAWVEGGSDGTCADFTLQDLRGFDFSNRNLRGAKFTGANLQRCRFQATNLTGADLYVVNLSDANLKTADLTESNLRGSVLRNADFTCATLVGADLREGRLMTRGARRNLEFLSHTLDDQDTMRRASMDGSQIPDKTKLAQLQ